MSKWISVKDRLPKEFEKVILHTTKSIFSDIVVGYRIICRDNTMEWYACGRGNSFICEGIGQITHWMPLPEPPEGKSNE